MFLVPPGLNSQTGPDRRDAAHGLILRVLVPVTALWLAVAGLGLLLIGPLEAWSRSESSLNKSLQDSRTPTWNSVTSVWSHVGNTEIIIGFCIVVVGALWWRTRRWWFAVVPAIAISLQATVFVTVAAFVGRPRPEVERLDPAPPTSSYPSGHVGASVALYASLAIMASGIQRTWLRRTVVGVCLVLPALVAYARLYRGMHHLSDVVVGALNGLVCAALAAYCLVQRPEDRAIAQGQKVDHR